MTKIEDIPYSQRIVLLPQCLRSNSCTSKRGEYGVLFCGECEQERDDGLICPISDMTSVALEVGYEGVYTFAGGRGIREFLLSKKGEIRAILAVACNPEIREGVEMLAETGIFHQVEHLRTEGCAETTLFSNPGNFNKEWERILTRNPPQNGN